MKKYITLAALLAAGTACANAAQTVVFDFGRTDADSYKTQDAICIGTGSTAYKEGISATGDLGIFSGSYSFTQEASRGNYSNSATLASGENNEDGWKNHLTEMPSGWGDTFADGLTCQWADNTGNTFTLEFSNLESGYYDLSVLGGYYGSDEISNTITLTLGGATTTETEWTLVDIGGNTAATTQSGVSVLTSSLTNTSANEGYTLDITKIFVGESGSLTVTIDGSETSGQRTPLNGLKLTFIPEPSAFGMLAGLGALALVASRRRRK